MNDEQKRATAIERCVAVFGEHRRSWIEAILDASGLLDTQDD